MRRPLPAPAIALVTVLVTGAAVAAGLLDAGMYARLGIPEAALGVRVAVAALTCLVGLTGALALGSLVYAAFLVPAQPSGVVSTAGYRAVRRAGVAAGVAGVAGLALAVVSAADLSGASPAAVLTTGAPLSTFAALEEPMGRLLTGVGFVLVALGCRWALRRGEVSVLAALALLAVLPPAAVGQGAVGSGHDWGTDAALLQAAGLALWLGVLAATALHRGPVGPQLRRRSRRVLLTAALTWAGSSLVLALLLVPPGSLTGTVWGRWQLVAAGLAVLAALLTGWVRLSAVAVALLVAVSGAMGHAVPPRFLVRPESALEILLGYDLPEPFGALRALVDWRPNILFCVLTAAAVGLYLAGVRALRRRGDDWARGRTAAWLCGWLLILVVTSSGIGRYGPALFSVHMLGHMTLGMTAPPLLALGGPVTLALRVLRPAGRGNPPGPREWVVGLVTAPVARVLTHPLVALALFVGSLYAFYFTGLFEGALRFHWAHQLMNLHFLAVGYLFYWPLIGVDRAPVRLPHLGRLAVLLAAMPFHAFFGIAVMSADEVLGGEFYRSLALPWVGDLLADQRVGGGIAWAAGELPTLLVVIVLLVQWSREDDRTAARQDRRAERDDDAELTAYNAMLARLAAGGRPR